MTLDMAEDECRCILAKPMEEIVVDLPLTIKAIQILRQHADGHRFYHSTERLEKALDIYRFIDGVLRDQIRLGRHQTEEWHRIETYHCKLGIAAIYLDLKQYRSNQSTPEGSTVELDKTAALVRDIHVSILFFFLQFLLLMCLH